MLVLLAIGYVLWPLPFSLAYTAIAVTAAAAVSRYSDRLFRPASDVFNKIARRRGLAVVMAGLFALVACVSLSLRLGVKSPDVTDEFSYLLGADTFARGRLSNSTHPMWQHFESIHIIHQPTYASKYLPGQPLMLTTGLLIANHPIVGVWLSMGLASSAVCWMLMGWLPLRWALLGGLLTTFHPMFVQWGQTYWGGAVAMMGGALLFGAARRIIEKRRARDAWIFGIGMAVLANSRPYEGAVLSLTAVCVLLAWGLKRRRQSLALLLRHIALPIVVMLALIAAWIGFYNLRVTGDPFRMPYLVHEEAYGIAPLFVFQDLRPEPRYRHKEIGDIHRGWELTDYLNQQSLSGFLIACRQKLEYLARWNLQVLAFMVSLVALPFALARDRWTRMALLACGLNIAAILPQTWLLPHYASPLAGLIFAITVQSMRHLNAWRWRSLRAGQHILRATLIVSALYLIFTWADLPPVDREAWNERRASMLEELKQSGERHLVVVRYAPGHAWGEEWVYNEADIDGAQVVWAREMGEESNRALIEYFKERRAWLLEVDAGRARLEPYKIESNETTDEHR
ncbi:MAG TPA: hypothetical protein VFQ92_02890 [Blastocatellia bacterium]|nr:hypothetical protein [Blastocatellia bacterium]